MNNHVTDNLSHNFYLWKEVVFQLQGSWLGEDCLTTKKNTHLTLLFSSIILHPCSIPTFQYFTLPRLFYMKSMEWGVDSWNVRWIPYFSIWNPCGTSSWNQWCQWPESWLVRLGVSQNGHKVVKYQPDWSKEGHENVASYNLTTGWCQQVQHFYFLKF